MKKKSIIALTLITLGIGSLSLPQTASAALPLAVDQQQLPSLAPMLERVTPAVVNISVEGTHTTKQQIPEAFKYFFGDNIPDTAKTRPFRALGSGVIIDANKGYLITNYHVVNGADKIKIQLTDGREFVVTLIGHDKLSDIALLQIKDAKNLTQIEIADSDKLRVGDFSVAIGNPFGLGQTVTSGIVSALGRSGLNIENVENFIQTDAAINSGNSGGALINLNGELIGINTAIIGPNGGNVGIGFAIPSNMVKNLTDQIIKYGSVKRGILGIIGGELTADLAQALGYKAQHGAFINQVMPESAADKAGLQAGDIIVSIDGKKIKSFGALRAKISTIGAGQKIKLGIIRDGKTHSYDVTLGSASDAHIVADSLNPALEGAKFANTTSEDKEQGVKVTVIKENSPAQQLGLQQDDIIIGINRQKVKNLSQLRKAIEGNEGVLALNIRRGDSSLYLIVR